MKQSFFILLLSVGLLSACNFKNTDKDTINQLEGNLKSAAFKDYIKKFPVLQLPFYFKGWNGNNIDRSKLFALDFNTSDTLFFTRKGIAKELASTIYGYGLLSDTSKFYSLIYFRQGEDIYPIICTYTKEGALIAQKTLLVYGCGSDCGLRYCSYTAQIDKQFNLYIADTMKYDYACDTLGNAKPNSDSTFIHAVTGNITATGDIRLGDIKFISLKNRP